MATQLNIYGEAAAPGGAVVTGGTATVPAGHRYRVTKMTGDVAAAGYLYIRITPVGGAAANRYAMYFWAAGNQSEDNLTLIVTAGEVVDLWGTAAAVTRGNITGWDELTPV